MISIKNKLRHFADIFFKRVQAQLGLAFLAKSRMDACKLAYSFLEADIISLTDCNEFITEFTDISTTEECQAEDKRGYRLFVIREMIRRNFAFLAKQNILEYLGSASYETRIKLDFLIEDYALILFPFLPPSQQFGKGDADQGADCSNDSENNFIIHDDLLLTKNIREIARNALFPTGKIKTRQESDNKEVIDDQQ